jgi:hypothetical protein
MNDSSKRCTWINEEEDGYKCQEIQNSCERITRGPKTCEYSGTAKTEDGKKNYDCFWLYSEEEGEKGNCKEKNDTVLLCGDAKREKQCPLSGVNSLEEKKCVWIPGGVVSRCVDVKSECEDLSNSTWCETNGAAVSETTTLECLWLHGSGTESGEGKCVSKVLLICCCYFCLYFFFFYLYSLLT